MVAGDTGAMVVLIMFIVYNIVPKGGKAVPVPYRVSFPRGAVVALSTVFHSIELGRGAI